MNTDSIGKQKKLFAIITAIVLLLLCMIPALFTGVAYADGGNGNSGSGSSENGGNDSSDPAELYYFSDCEYGEYFRDGLIDLGIVGSIEYYYWEPDVFQETFRTNYKNGDYSGIRDTHIIFEMRKKLEPEVLSSDSFVYILRDFFSEMKSNNCQIMFICGTDGSRFAGVDDFLDDAVIHVDTDLLHTFVTSVLDGVTDDCGNEQISDCTFLIDNNFALDGKYGNEWYQSEFFRIYFLAFIKSVYRCEIEGNGKSVMDVFDSSSIKVLYNTYGSEYIDVYKLYKNEDPYVYIDEYGSFYSEYMDGQRVYAIGKAWDESYYREWLQYLHDLQDDTFNFPIYVYNTEADFIISGDINNKYFTCGYVKEVEIFAMMIDFLQNQNLSIYDNWSGRCIVTHKMVEQGPNGWMVDIYSSDYTGLLSAIATDGWRAYMCEEDYSYIFSEDNIF